MSNENNFTKPPQKHKAIINEWIDSGGKKTIQQREFNSSLNIYMCGLMIDIQLG